MPIRVPLAGPLPLLDTGNQTVRTAQLQTTGPEMGRAIMQAGAELMGVSNLIREADDAKNLTDANMIMQQAQLDFSKFQQQTPDESQWTPVWEKTVKNVQSQLDKLSLSSRAKQSLAGRFGNWSMQNTIAVSSEAMRQKERNLVTSVQTARQMAKLSGDFSMVEQAIDDIRPVVGDAAADAFRADVETDKYQRFEVDYRAQRSEAVKVGDYATASLLDDQAKERGILTPGQYEVLQKENVRGQLVADIQKEADVDPRKAKDLLKTYDTLPKEDRFNLERYIESQENDRQIAEAKQIADDIAVGKVRTSGDLQFQWVRPADQIKFRQALDSIPPSTQETALELIDLERQIDKFDTTAYANRSMDTMLEYVTISKRINDLPPNVKDDLSAKWDKRRSGQQPTTKESFVATGLDVIQALVKQKESEFFKRSGQEKFIREGKEAEFSAFKLRITKMHNELKRLMPDNPTPEQAMDIIQRVTGSAVSDQVRNAYRVQPMIPAAGPENPAMPAFGPGIPNPILLPSVNP